MFWSVLIMAVSAALVFYGIQAWIGWSTQKYFVTAENAPTADAVMVLGAMVYGDTPSAVLEDRLLYANQLYQAGKAKKILCSGDHGTKEYDEVNAMKDFLLEKGVPREDIFMDHAGFDTYDSMYRAKEIFQVKTLLISTQSFHMPRALYLAHKLGIKAYGYPCPDKEIYDMKMLNKRESLANVKAVLDADLLRRKPKWEGDAIPIWKDGILTEG